MPTPTVLVTVRLRASDAGAPYAGVTVTALLDKADAYVNGGNGGLVIPAPITGVSDENGDVVLSQFPNAVTDGLGTTGSIWNYTARPHGAVDWHYAAQVPNKPCILNELPNLLEAPPPPAFQSRLAASGGAALVGYGNRTVEQALNDVRSIRYFGARANGTGNDDDAVALAFGAINAGEISGLFLQGWCVLHSAPPPITRPEFFIEGVGRKNCGFLQTENADVLWVKSVDPSTTQTYDITLRGFGIQQVKANPTAGLSLRMTRATQCNVDIDIQNVFRGLLIEGGNDQRYNMLRVTGSPSWGAVATGSYLVKLTNYTGTTEIPSEVFMPGANIKGYGIGDGNTYLDKAVIAECFDGWTLTNGHVGFSNGPALYLNPQNNAALTMQTGKFGGTYFDGNLGGDPTSAGVLLDGSTTPVIRDLDFIGATFKNWLGKGARFNSTKLKGLYIDGGAASEDNGKEGIEIIGASEFSVDANVARNNGGNTGANAVVLSGASKGSVSGGIRGGSHTHPIGLSIDATCADIELGTLVFDGHTKNIDVAAGALRIGHKSYTATATGFTISPTCTIEYSVVGRVVALHIIGGLSATSNATSFMLTGAPADIRPPSTQAFILRTSDNGAAHVYSLAQMDSAGTITIFNGPEGAAFTNSGTKGVAQQNFTYLLT